MPSSTREEQNGRHGRCLPLRRQLLDPPPPRRRPPPPPPAYSFPPRAPLAVGDRHFEVRRLDALAGRFDIARLPYAMKVLLENLLRHEDGRQVHAADIEAVAGWVGRQEAGIASNT